MAGAKLRPHASGPITSKGFVYGRRCFRILLRLLSIFNPALTLLDAVPEAAVFRLVVVFILVC